MNKRIGLALMLALACAALGQPLPAQPLPGQAQPLADGDEAAALEALRAAPDQVEPYIRLAAINDRRGKLHISRNYLLRALELAPGHSGVHHLLSVNYARIEDWEKAFVHMETALKSEPRNAAMRYNAGNLFHNTGKFPEASQQYRRAHLLDPVNFQYHYSLALATELADQREEALAEWTRVIEAHPGKAAPYSRRATLMMSLGRREEAHRDAAKAISLDPKSADAHYVLGRIHEQDRELPQALEAYAQVVAIDPEHVQTRYRLSLVHRRLGDAEEAGKQSHLYRSLKARNDALDTVARAANSIATGNYGFAETQLREAVRIDPENVQALYHLGMVQQEQHKFADAATTFRTVLSLDPELAMARATLGLALAELGRPEEARHELARPWSRAVTAMKWPSSPDVGFSVSKTSLGPKPLSCGRSICGLLIPGRLPARSSSTSCRTRRSGRGPTPTWPRRPTPTMRSCSSWWACSGRVKASSNGRAAGCNERERPCPGTTTFPICWQRSMS